MIRVLLGSALPALGVVAVAAALVGPSLVSSPRGEPMLVTSGEDGARLQPAAFELTDCASLRLLALHIGTDGLGFALQPVSEETPAPEGALLIVIGPAGEIVGVSPAGAFGDAAAAMLSSGCYGEAEAPAPGAI